MKKLLVLVFALANCMFTIAQNYEILYVETIEENHTFMYCESSVDGILIYGQEGCEWNQFTINYQTVIEGDSVLLTEKIQYYIVFDGCDWFSRHFMIKFTSSNVSNPFPEPIIWKRAGESVTLGDEENTSFDWSWSTGETTPAIEVTEPGTYTATLSDLCGSETYSVEVRDNVEIESASVDPDSNKNLVTWETTPEQAEYISQVTIARDGVDMATVPYNDGQFLDNIGSDLAARIYTITGVCTDGTLCPIPSLERGTIHMAFLPDINGNVEMTWNAPHLGGAPIHVGRYEICEYDPNAKGEVIVIDFVSAGTTSYSCSQSMFDYGYPLIRAVIQDDRGRGKDMLSNRTDELVGIHEVEGKSLTIYPNPTQYSFTVSGVEKGKITMINGLGQQVLCQEITGETTINVDGLPSGIYVTKVITPEGMMYTERVVVQ